MPYALLVGLSAVVCHLDSPAQSWSRHLNSVLDQPGTIAALSLLTSGVDVPARR